MKKMNEDKTCMTCGVVGLTVDELPDGISNQLMWKAIKYVIERESGKTNKCGRCRYNGVKGLIADEELYKGVLEELSSRDIAELTESYGCNFPDYDCAIFFGGPDELLPYSKIVDLADPNKSCSPFETDEGRILTDFSFCFVRINGYLENIADSEMQTMVAMGRLIDIAREMNDGNGRIAMLTYDKYKGCSRFQEEELMVDLTDILNQPAKRYVYS